MNSECVKESAQSTGYHVILDDIDRVIIRTICAGMQDYQVRDAGICGCPSVRDDLRRLQDFGRA